jgi:putative zinc finger/helix-turn-helix YgiT family protein
MSDRPPIRRCVRCTTTAPLVERQAQLAREVAGHLFMAFLPARVCPACSETYFDAKVVERFDLHVAMRLADAGIVTGEAIRFMRKALRMQANTLAELVDVAPETVSRWEGDKRAVSRGASAILTALVRDAFEGRTTTLDGLRRLQRPSALAKTVQIEISLPPS